MTSDMKEFPDYVPEDGITASELVSGLIYLWFEYLTREYYGG